MRGRIWIIPVIVLLAFLFQPMGLWSREDNGFDLQGALIPRAEIHHGGPPRDGIPALVDPKFVRARAVTWLKPDDRILALQLDGVAKAYPIAILNWHEIVNDRIGERRLVVTYCPLCGSGMAFDARVDGAPLEFGVSGLLYNSDVLLYDRRTESLWSQLLRQAVSGPLKGHRLRMLPLQHTSWRQWRKAHPHTLVLSADTGYDRDYRRDPYAGYADAKGLYFPVDHLDPRYPPKQPTLGLELDGVFWAYPLVELEKAGGMVQVKDAQGRSYRVSYDADSQSAWVEDAQGKRLPSVIGYWFAWMAFHPDSRVYTAP